MKLIEKDERYVFECCSYEFRVDNGIARIDDKKRNPRWLFHFFFGGVTRGILNVRFCPECGLLIPNQEEKEK